MEKLFLVAICLAFVASTHPLSTLASVTVPMVPTVPTLPAVPTVPTPAHVYYFPVIMNR
jgi:hypothetical protein